MTETRRLELQAQLDAALSEREAAKAEAIRHTIDRETLECTAHTAERLKRVEADVVEIKSTVNRVSEEVHGVGIDVMSLRSAVTAAQHEASEAKGGSKLVELLVKYGGWIVAGLVAIIAKLLNASIPTISQ